MDEHFEKWFYKILPLLVIVFDSTIYVKKEKVINTSWIKGAIQAWHTSKDHFLKPQLLKKIKRFL